MLEALATVNRLLSRFFMLVAGIGLLVMTAIIGWQVIARYILNDSPAWAEQSALVLMLWFIGLAAAAGVREGFHIKMGVAESMAGPGGAKAVRILCHLIVGGIGLVMALQGVDLVRGTWGFTIPTLGLPRGVAYLPLPIFGGLSVLFVVEHILAELAGKEVKPSWN